MKLLNWTSITKGIFWQSWSKNNSKPFWSTCKLYLSNKNKKGYADILHIENNQILLDNHKVVIVFNKIFSISH